MHFQVYANGIPIYFIKTERICYKNESDVKKKNQRQVHDHITCVNKCYIEQKKKKKMKYLKGNFLEFSYDQINAL